jgi:hypothetical protein
MNSDNYKQEIHKIIEGVEDLGVLRKIYLLIVAITTGGQ